jgi:isopentenyl diphosphate isomerase/L-lactate dehydrogenase-like FMN-dependent dehydrogenase
LTDAVPDADLPWLVSEFERRAREVLEEGPLSYYASGAGAELTLADNVAAWHRLRLAPRMLVGVAERDLSTTVLGRTLPHPLVVAPMAFQRLAHPDGEPALARAAAATGATFTLSTLATASQAEVAEAAPGAPRWFQLYVFRDRGATDALVQSAAEHGFEALVVTVDLPVLGLRESDVALGYMLPLELPVPTVEAAHGRPATIAETAALIDPGLTWDDVERLADGPLPVIVKGVLRPDDARRAIDHGARAIVVSNHGGRQLDTTLASAEALPPIAEEVGGEVDLLVDGGIRRGTDVLKAVALGARAVMVGRPVLWGLACGGEDGARRVLELLIDDVDRTLALAGTPVLSRVDRDVLA